MFCKNCGTQLSESSKFCPSCGKRTSANASNQILLKAGPEKSTVNMLIVVCVMFGILSVVMWITYLMAGVSSYGRDGLTNDEKTMFLIIAIAAFVGTIIQLPRLAELKQMTICVCENKVYGTYALNKQFEFLYSDIINVKCVRGKIVTIEAKAQTCACTVEKANEICTLIQKKISQQR
jgi:RNA polymerase subunit RPABC4/transcription elongation factor Spt4/predicted HTH domain antitoxin